MPTGQEIGEPKVEIKLDREAKLATVTVSGLLPKYRTPEVKATDTAVEVLYADPKSEIKAEWTQTPNGPGDVLVVSGICLQRCLDEPGRVSEEDILHHVMHMAATALADHMEAIRSNDEVLQKQMDEMRQAAERKRNLRPSVI